MQPVDIVLGSLGRPRRRVRYWRADRQYVRGYKRYPETEEEVAWAVAASHWALEEYPWEEEEPT
tara:strand:- start:58 stop:249 length:192 start_codon:yes stop_codon:yes gene_type:complete